MLTQLTLTQFRSYQDYRLKIPEGCQFILIDGPNGSGKTNLLEAISYLSPGRGLRKADNDQVSTISHDLNEWSVAATSDGIEIVTGQRPDRKRRFITVSGENQSSQSILSEYLSVVWLTPQMDGLFLAQSSERRYFFDHLIYAFDPKHAGRLRRYENALRQRNRMLKDGVTDETWYQSVEQILAQTAVSISALRLNLIGQLNQLLLEEIDTPFLQPKLMLEGDPANYLMTGQSASQAEVAFLEQLQRTRSADQQTGYTTTGPHRSDITALHPGKNDLAADQCSTGEQKAMLIATVLAHARLIRRTSSRPMILLLDDLVSHLDRDRQSALLEWLKSEQVQCWITGTDLNGVIGQLDPDSILSISTDAVPSPDIRVVDSRG